MGKLLLMSTVFLLFGSIGCGNSECRNVRDLEIPAAEALAKDEQLLVYWENLYSSEKSGETEVCKQNLKFNRKTSTFEVTGYVCNKETGVVSGKTIDGVERARQTYSKSFETWKKIVNLYPDCFEPQKVIKANS